MIIIYDFGSQYTQLIAKRVREAGVYAEVIPYYKDLPSNVSGVILSGSPDSVLFTAKDFDFTQISSLPTLAICFGAQLFVHKFGGAIESGTSREYGESKMNIVLKDPLFEGIPETSTVWMSHGDSIVHLPDDFTLLGSTEDVKNAVFKHGNVYGVQFHPEVSHTPIGKKMIENFAIRICNESGDWSPKKFISMWDKQVNIGAEEQVIMALSGGVDSSVAAVLLHRNIGDRLHCVFVNNGLLRKNEYETVLQNYKSLGLNITGIDASKRFYEVLRDVTDPEKKRKLIGGVFIEIFEEFARGVNATWLGQGTIYPDIIESVGNTIKSHHNVGGLPEKMHLRLIEPIKTLFKYEVRNIGLELGIPDYIINRHPFPGPGLAIRIIGAVTPDNIRILQEADDIFISLLKEADEYKNIWQAGAIFLPIKSVGVMGDARTYENVICLRAVVSQDGMTANWYHIPPDLLSKISNEIIRKVPGINRVVLDISSKPPATIEWE